MRRPLHEQDYLYCLLKLCDLASGQAFERRTEITPLGPAAVVDGFVVIRVAEEKAEITYLDALFLEIGGVVVAAEDAPAAAAVDGACLVLRQGKARDLRFRVPGSWADGDPVSVIATGYYTPGE